MKSENQKEIERLNSIKERLEDTREEIDSKIENYVSNIRSSYGLDMSDEEYEKIWQESIDREIEKFLNDANKSYMSEEDKQKVIDQKKRRSQEEFAYMMEQRRKYMSMTEDEIRQEYVSKKREDYNLRVLDSATDGIYSESYSENTDWAKNKETRTLVGEIRFIEFMNLDQRQKRQYIRAEIGRIIHDLAGMTVTGGALGILAGFVLAAGIDLSPELLGEAGIGFASDQQVYATFFGSVAFGALLTPIIGALKRSKAFQLLKKMREYKKDAKIERYEQVVPLARESHSAEEVFPNEKTYLENLDMVSLVQDHAEHPSEKLKRF